MTSTVGLAAPVRTRSVGFWTAVSIVMGNMIGSGIFLLPASLAPYGAISLAGWIVSAGGSILLALVFAGLARRHPATGGPYAYTRLAFGDFAGFLVAWGYWISVWCTLAALAVAFVGYLDPFAPALVRRPALAAVAAVAAVWILTIVNLRGVAAAGRVQLITTVLKLVPLVVVGIGGLSFLDPTHFTIADTSVRSLGRATTATATLTLWAFLGLECATIPAGDIRDPEVTIPRATIVGTAATAIVYIAGTIAVMGLIAPEALGRTTAPYAEAARVFGGSAAAVVVAAGAAISCFGALNGWILVAGQWPAAVARDRLFPGIFARASSSGTPAAALVIGSALATALIAMNYTRGLVDLFTFIILLATLSTLVPYAFCSVAGLLDRDSLGRRRPSLVHLLAFAYSVWAIAGAGADVVYWGFLLLILGLPVYVIVKAPAARATSSGRAD